MGEVVPRDQGLGVVGAHHPHAVGQGLLVQRDGPAQVPRRLVGAGEVVPRDQGVGVVGAQHPLAGRRGSARTAGWPGPGPLPSRRRRRGCSARPGCRGGRRPAPAAGRRGSARAAGWPGPGPLPSVGGGEVVPRGQGVGVVGAQHPQSAGQGALEVPGRAAGLALVVEELSGLVEEVGGVLGVGVRRRVAGQGVDVREQHPPARPARRVPPVGDGVGELAGGLVPGGVDRLGVTVGVARVGGAGHGLHQAVHGQGARAGGEHAVGGQAADRAQHRRRVAQPVQQGPGDRVGGVPGQDPQHLPGQRVIGQPVHGDAPDPGDGAGGVAAFRRGLVHGGRVAGQQIQVLPRGGAGLGQVGAGLLDGQRQGA